MYYQPFHGKTGFPFNSLPQSAFFTKVLGRLLHAEPFSSYFREVTREEEGLTEGTRKTHKIFQSLLKLVFPEEGFQTHFTTLPVSYNTMSAK